MMYCVYEILYHVRVYIKATLKINYRSSSENLQDVSAIELNPFVKNLHANKAN